MSLWNVYTVHPGNVCYRLWEVWDLKPRRESTKRFKRKIALGHGGVGNSSVIVEIALGSKGQSPGQPVPPETPLWREVPAYLVSRLCSTRCMSARSAVMLCYSAGEQGQPTVGQGWKLWLGWSQWGSEILS